MHRDVHNQRGVPNVVLPIVSSGGGLWLQKRPDDNVPVEVRKDDKGKEIEGCVHTYNSHEPFIFEPHGWHESVVSSGPQLLLFGYTARGLQTLGKQDRQKLWDLGFTYVPATKTEYWGYKTSAGTLVRYHPVPRRQLFVPTDSDMLPFPRSWFGELRLCEEHFQCQEPVRAFHCWRKGRGRAPASKWTGWSAFPLHLRGPSCARSGGGSDADLDANRGTDAGVKKAVSRTGGVKGCAVHSFNSINADDVVGTGGVNSVAQTLDVVELFHQDERLSMLRPASELPAQHRIAACSVGAVGRSTRPRGPRCRSPETLDCGRVNVVHEMSGIEGRGRTCCEATGLRRSSSLPPVCGWGARYAARFRLRSVQPAGESVKPSPEGSATVASDACPVVYIKENLLSKGIEDLPPPRPKVTVSEELPEWCPSQVYLTCLIAELKVLWGKVQTSEASRMLGTWDGRDEGIEDLMRFQVPDCIKPLRLCRSSDTCDSSYTLEGVNWPMSVNVTDTLQGLAEQHRVRCSMLDVQSDEAECQTRDFEADWAAEVQGLECELRELAEIEHRMVMSLQGPLLRSVHVGADEENDEGSTPVHCGADALEGDSKGAVLQPSEATVLRPSEAAEDPPPVQTKIIAADQVRKESAKWIPAMTEEYESLVSKTGAVEEISDSDYRALIENPEVSVELIPGKLVYVRKTSGQRKARIVGCGNFCVQSSGGPRSELYASGAGAESLRMTMRKTILEPTWSLASVDVKTAFLQAPLLDLQRDGKQLITIVRVPHILRELGITTCRFWRVKKALYGLASAPKSWSRHRDKVLSELRIPHETGMLVMTKLPEDTNLLHVLKIPSENSLQAGTEGALKGAQKVGVIALYVDDILIGAPRSIVEAVIAALQSQWELSSPEWVDKPGDNMKFAGFELERTAEGLRVHQESYVRDLLDQYHDEIPGEENAPAVKVYETSSLDLDTDVTSVVKRAQALIGQLLWLSNRTRPDLAYAVNIAAQKIVANPCEAVARAEHAIRYLRHAPGVSLHYKPATGNCGKWDQLRFQETATSLDSYSDASFAADEQCRSFGCIQLFWAGALIAWSSNRQTLIASHTAECELYSLAEAHLLGKAMRPTVAALMNVSEKEIDGRLYCDNAAAIQLCVLESGAWRTRHLRLRGAVIRQDLEEGLWVLSHLDGVFMPADLGTKPVGPARLEDLIKVCDLWAPHLSSSVDPPRPQVAAMHRTPGEVSRALLALLLLVQVSSVKADDLQNHVDGLNTLWQSFVIGFGIGCGWWLAGRLGSLLEGCFGRCLGRRGSKRPAAVPSRSDMCIQTEELCVRGAFETGEHGSTSIHSLQNEATVRELEDAGAFQSDSHGWEPRTVEGDYESLCEEQDPFLAGSSGSAGLGAGLYEPLGVGDREGRSEAASLNARVEYDAAHAFAQVQQVDMFFVPRPDRLPPGDMVELARAPTVPRPPGYPYPVDQVDRIMYVDDEAELGEKAESDEDLSSQGSEDHSTIGQWTTDSGMPGGRSRSSGSGGSGVGSRSVAAVSLASSVRSVQASREIEASSGSWELWGVVVLLVSCSMLLGAACLYAAWWCTKSRTVKMSSDEDWGHDDGNEDLCPSKVQTPVRRRRGSPVVLSPVVNINVTNEASRQSEEKHERELTAHAASVLGENPSAASSSVGPCGLGLSSNPKIREKTGVQSQSPVGLCGLGLPSGPKTQETTGVQSRGPVGPYGLGLPNDPKTRETTGTPSQSPVGPCGLGLPRLPGRSSTQQRAGSGEQASGSSDQLVDIPVDYVPKPRDFKKYQIYSCSEVVGDHVVLLTQNGDCFHRTLQCPAASKSSAVRIRYTCSVCNAGEEFPRQDVVRFTRLGRRVHGNSTCPALDTAQEVLARRRCKFCESR